MNGKSERDLYPKTGHFLAGRLRQAMSELERAELEALAADVQTFEAGHRLIARGDVCDCSTMLVEGFMLLFYAPWYGAFAILLGILVVYALAVAAAWQET